MPSEIMGKKKIIQLIQLTADQILYSERIRYFYFVAVVLAKINNLFYTLFLSFGRGFPLPERCVTLGRQAFFSPQTTSMLCLNALNMLINFPHFCLRRLNKRRLTNFIMARTAGFNIVGKLIDYFYVQGL